MTYRFLLTSFRGYEVVFLQRPPPESWQLFEVGSSKNPPTARTRGGVPLLQISASFLAFLSLPPSVLFPRIVLRILRPFLGLPYISECFFPKPRSKETPQNQENLKITIHLVKSNFFSLHGVRCCTGPRLFPPPFFFKEKV